MLFPMRIGRRWPGAAVVLLVLVCRVPQPSRACDLCAVYRATEIGYGEKGFGVGVAEQFSDFSTLKQDGEKVDNPADERLYSSITQLYLSYDFASWMGAQLNLPIITRSFRRVAGGGIETGDETGFGDLTLLANVYPYAFVGEKTLFRSSLSGGLKLPSGSADRLREEIGEENNGHAHGCDPFLPPRLRQGCAEDDGGAAHHDPGAETSSGIHGHDLALGTRSTDVILGGSLFGSWDRAFLTASLQYVIRTTGAFDYRYANDLLWSGGPGVFALVDDDYSLGIQALLTGETKGKDELDGDPVDDTAITSLYVGPAVRATWKSRFALELAADLPAIQNNSSLQIVPDYRLRGGLVWRF
jgi:hypothetical protein